MHFSKIMIGITTLLAAFTFLTLSNSHENVVAKTPKKDTQTKKIADISEFQGNIDWKRAAKQLDLAIIRVQYGSEQNTDYKLDDKVSVNNNQARQNNVPFANYAYSRFTSAENTADAARSFYAHADKNAKFYVLDDEQHIGSGNEQEYINAWLAQMRQLTKKKIIIYSYNSYI